jgi:hypothetical protein
MGLLARRILFGGFAVIFLAVAAYQYHAAGFTGMTAFSGASGLVLAIAAITAKG